MLYLQLGVLWVTQDIQLENCRDKSSLISTDNQQAAAEIYFSSHSHLSIYLPSLFWTLQLSLRPYYPDNLANLVVPRQSHSSVMGSSVFSTCILVINKNIEKVIQYHLESLEIIYG